VLRGRASAAFLPSHFMPLSRPGQLREPPKLLIVDDSIAFLGGNEHSATSTPSTGAT